MKRKAYNFEGRVNSLIRSKQGVFLKLELTPNDLPEELLTAAVGQRLMVAVSEIGDMDEDIGEGDRALQQAGMLCRAHDFQNFLQEQTYPHGVRIPEATEEGAAKALKALLKISTRTLIRDSDVTRERFRELERRYEEWLDPSI